VTEAAKKVSLPIVNNLPSIPSPGILGKAVPSADWGFKCDKIHARLLETACAKMHVAATNAKCATCEDGERRAIEQGIKSVRKVRPEKLVRNPTCKRCKEKFETADRRQHYCDTCTTNKYRLKRSVDEAVKMLRDCGHRVDINPSPNGAVIVFRGTMVEAEDAVRVMVLAGYGVRIDAINVGTAVAVIDLANRLRMPQIRVRFGEQRTRLRAGVSDAAEFDGSAMFDEEQLGLFE
jgi:hypothetical protein